MNNTYHISWPLPVRGTGSAHNMHFYTFRASRETDEAPGLRAPCRHPAPGGTRRFQGYMYFHPVVLQLYGCCTWKRLLKYRRLLWLAQSLYYLQETSAYIQIGR